MQLRKILASVFSSIAVLSVTAAASSDKVLISGRGIGLTLNSEGAMVTDTAQIQTADNKTVAPAKDGGIKKGDVITKIDGDTIRCVDDLHAALDKTKDSAVMVEINRSGSKIILKIKPEKSSDGAYRLGIWAKDMASGIGTLTFYDPETGNFGALGHGISDNSSGTLIEIDGGEVLTSTIVAVQKGKEGKPGELQGVFDVKEEPIGVIEKNTSCGIFGKMELSKDEAEKAQSIKVGKKEDVRVGKAYILANVEGNKTEKFDIEICKIPAFTGDKTKGMVIRITDKELLQKTGGIVRGMSGCPIVQSGRLIGAVTHVFINDPTSGYGIFMEDMLSAMES